MQEKINWQLSVLLRHAYLSRNLLYSVATTLLNEKRKNNGKRQKVKYIRRLHDSDKSETRRRVDSKKVT